MSQTQGMTYQTIVNQIQLQTLNDPTAPNSSTQEYQTYTQLIANLAIPTWENERGVLWNELWVDQVNYATIVVSQPDIALPSDFKFIGGGFVRLTYPGSTASSPQIRAFPVKMLPEIELNTLQNLPEWYIYGNIQTGFFLRCGWIPQTGSAEIGATLSFRYYAYAQTPQLSSSSVLLNPNDVPQMSDPNFIIYKVSAMVSANNFNMQLYQIQEDKANYSLKNMVMANSMASNFMDDYIKDIDGLADMGARIPNRMNSGFWTGSYGPSSW
jgi:hypothetical protein